MERCEQCGKALAEGDFVARVDDDPPRYWHAECLDASLTPLADWPKSERK